MSAKPTRNSVQTSFQKISSARAVFLQRNLKIGVDKYVKNNFSVGVSLLELTLGAGAGLCVES